MKKIKNIGINTLLGGVLMLFTFASCDGDSNSGSTASTGKPVISSVSPSLNEDGQPSDLTPVTIGYADNMYIIHGSGFQSLQKIYFNDTDTAFNSMLVTDTDIFVTIDRNTPYENASNQLKIVTAGGTATFDFVVAPPAPSMTSYNPINAAAGSTIKIYGSFFLDPIVKFGDTEAVIVSSSLTEITVTVPVGAEHKYVSVTTISGEAISKQAVGTAIFDDVFYGDWAMSAPAAIIDATPTKTPSQGLKLIEGAVDGWGNIGTSWIWNDQISAYKGLRIAIKGKNAGKVAIIFNGHWDDSISALLDITTEWKTFEIPWSTFGPVPAVQNITIKNNTGDPNVFYVDDIGYVLND